VPLPHKALDELVWVKDAAEGTLRATFSRFHTVDHDGDVTLPSAFTDGQAVPMVWSHDWNRPVGRGTIEVKRDRAVFAGAFFLQTASGAEAYGIVKAMAELQQYSYGYQPLEAEPGIHEGQPVRFLKKLQVFEVSPVLVGAGVGTGTERIKQADPPGEDVALEEKPFANEHACRLADPGRFDRFRRSNDDRRHQGKRIDVIYGHPTSGGGWEQQSLRLPTSSWDAAAARSYCATQSGSFEAASAKDAQDDPLESFVDHGDRVLGAVTDYLARAQQIAALRARDGRPLTEGKRVKLTTLLEALAAVRGDVEELLRAPAPSSSEPDLDALFDRFRQLQARHGGGQ
jgi:HK97 family phage prohead protease